MVVGPKLNELQYLFGDLIVRLCLVCFTFNLTFFDRRPFSLSNTYVNIFIFFIIWSLKMPLLMLLADAHLPICFFAWRTVVWSRFGRAVVSRWLKDVVIYTGCVFSASMPLHCISDSVVVVCSMLLHSIRMSRGSGTTFRKR